MEQKRVNQENIEWEKFDRKEGSGTFLILQDNQTATLGIMGIRQATAMFERKQKDGTQKLTEVPQIHLVLDYLNGVKLEEEMVFPTGAKYLIAYIKQYHESGILYTFFFSLSRAGVGMSTKYTLAPTKERPKKA